MRAVGAAKALCLLALLAVVVWVAGYLGATGHVVPVVLVAVAGLGLLLLYAARRPVRTKYLLPGALALLLLQVWPTLFSLAVSVTNYGGNHVDSKEAAIAVTVRDSLRPTEHGVPYAYTPAVRAGDPADSGRLVMLLHDPRGLSYVADGTGLVPLVPAQVTTAPDGHVTAAPGYTVLDPATVEARRRDVESVKRLTAPEAGVVATSATAAVGARPSIVYDSGKDRVLDTDTGRVFIPKNGELRSLDGVTLPVGWFEAVGMNNYVTVLTDPVVRGSVLGVLAWTLVFAAVSVVLAFILGLAATLVLDDPRMRGRRLYRSLIIVPYAVPLFVTALLWRGMFDTEGGPVDQVLGALGVRPDWLGTPWLARLLTVAVNVWATFPFMYLLTSAVLRAVPRGIRETARLDGAGLVATLRSVMLPTVLSGAMPALLASFASNLNNFTLVHLLTGGGPVPGASPQNTAGATDLLITYAYRLGFGDNARGYGVAAAVAVLATVFSGLVVAASYRNSRVLAELRARPGRVVRDETPGVLDYSARVEEPVFAPEHEEELPSGHRLTVIRHVLAVLLCLVALAPVGYLLLAAVNPGVALETSSFAPTGVSAAGYAALVDSSPYWGWYGRSLLVAGLATALVVVMATFLAYAASRFRGSARRAGLAVLLLLGIVPTVTVFIGTVVTVRAIGTVLPGLGADSVGGLVLAHTGLLLAWATWLVKGHVDALTQDYDESLVLDGVPHLIVFLLVIRRMRGVVLTTAALTFVQLWGEYLLAGLLLTTPETQTLPVGLAALLGGTAGGRDFGAFAAGAILASIPTVAVHLVFQDRLVRTHTLRPAR